MTTTQSREERAPKSMGIMRARASIVSVGAVTAFGTGADVLWGEVKAGSVAISTVDGIDLNGIRTQIAGTYRDSAAIAEARGTQAERDRVIELAIVAVREARQALPADLVKGLVGAVVVGTCNAGLLSAKTWLGSGASLTAVKTRELLSQVIPQGLAEAIANELNITGPVLAVNTACASGANSIGIGLDLISSGQADVVFAGGSDALSDIAFAGFNALESLSPTPAAPYSLDRSGLSLGEGASFLVLVSPEVAASRNLDVVADVVGYGLSADGYHVTAPRPDGSGAATAMLAALTMAGVQATDVDYVNGHGTGTPKNDSAESNAIMLALTPEHAKTIPISSTKSQIGHLLGAAGTTEAIVTALSLKQGFVPPTANYQVADPECPLDYVANVGRKKEIRLALSNNFAFGGANACVAIAPPSADRIAPRAVDYPVDTVVVTGLSAVSPFGSSKELATAIEADRPISASSSSPRLLLADIDIDEYLSKRERRRMDRQSILSIASSHDALRSAGLLKDEDARRSAGMFFGTSMGSVEAMSDFVRSVVDGGYAAADPGMFPNTVYNQAAGQIARQFSLWGPTTTISTGGTTALSVLWYASEYIRSGRAERIVCTLTEAPNDDVLRAYDRAGYLRDGDLEPALIESSISIVLESSSSARARGAKVLGSIAEFGMGFAATECTGESAGRGLETSLRRLMQRDRHDVSEIDTVWRMRTVNRLRERAESESMRRFLGPQQPRRIDIRRRLGDFAGVSGAAAVCGELLGETEGNSRSLIVGTTGGGSATTLILRRQVEVKSEGVRR